LGVVGLSSRRCYPMVFGEFPCCLVGGRLGSVGAVVFLVLCCSCLAVSAVVLYVSMRYEIFSIQEACSALAGTKCLQCHSIQMRMLSSLHSAQ
jgi:hypothetical protein